MAQQSQSAQPSGRQLIVINTPSSHVSETEVRLMISASSILMGQVVSHWNLATNISLHLWDDMAAQKVPVNSNAVLFYLLDSQNNAPNVLNAYQELKNLSGKSYMVPTQPVLSNGGTSLSNESGSSTVAAGLFRVMVNALVNPFENTWWHDTVSGESVFADICSPVESLPVTVTLTLTPPPTQTNKAEPVSRGSDQSHASENLEEQDADSMPPLEDVSALAEDANTPQAETKTEVKQQDPIKINVVLCDFALPDWSNPSAPAGSQVDFLNVLKEPFQVAAGGCCLKYDSVGDSGPRYTFDRHMPAWRRDLKRAEQVMNPAR